LPRRARRRLGRGRPPRAPRADPRGRADRRRSHVPSPSAAGGPVLAAVAAPLLMTPPRDPNHDHEAPGPDRPAGWLARAVRSRAVAGMLGTWQGWLILAVIGSQLLLPLHYYTARRDRHDE